MLLVAVSTSSLSWALPGSFQPKKPQQPLCCCLKGLCTGAGDTFPGQLQPEWDMASIYPLEVPGLLRHLIKILITFLFPGQNGNVIPWMSPGSSPVTGYKRHKTQCLSVQKQHTVFTRKGHMLTQICPECTMRKVLQHVSLLSSLLVFPGTFFLHFLLAKSSVVVIATSVWLSL